MPLSEDVHATVDRYQRDVVHAVDRIGDLATDVDALAHRLAVGGPLGQTADPDLATARQRIAWAAARIRAAGTSVAASGRPCEEYLRRAFPR